MGAPKREEQQEVVRAELQTQVEQPNRLLVLAEGKADAAEVYKVLGLALRFEGEEKDISEVCRR